MKKAVTFLLSGLFFVSALSQHLEKPCLWIKAGLTADSSLNLIQIEPPIPCLQKRGQADSLSWGMINFNPALRIQGGDLEYYVVWDSLQSSDYLTVMTAYHSLEKDRQLGLWELKRDTLPLLGLTGRDLRLGEINLRYSDTNYRCPVVNATSQAVDAGGLESFSRDSLFFLKGGGCRFEGNFGESMVFKRRLDKGEQDRWQSYLSIKYGATIVKGYYLSAMGDTLWHYDWDPLYSAGVAGLGFDSLTGLNQKQSCIYGDCLSLSSQCEYADSESNPHTLPQGHYLLWGHNGHSPEFESEKRKKDTAAFHLLQRRWKIRLGYRDIKRDFPTELSYAYEPETDPEKLFLAVGLAAEERADLEGATLYPADSITEDRVYFKNCFWGRNASEGETFTLVYGGDLMEEAQKRSLSGASSNGTPDEGGEGSRTIISGEDIEITLYPNPGKGEYNLLIDLREESPVKITLFDAQGKLLRQIRHSGEKHYEIRDKVLTKGNHIFRIEYGKGSKNVKWTAY